MRDSPRHQNPEPERSRDSELGKVLRRVAQTAFAAAALHAAPGPAPAQTPQVSAWPAHVTQEKKPDKIKIMLEAPRVMRTYGDAHPPKAFDSFCFRYPDECTPLGLEARKLAQRKLGTPEEMSLLQSVQAKVNKEMRPTTDREQHGVEDRWDKHAKKGDCEEYAITKRDALIAEGWSPAQLLLTFVYTPQGEGHAVLLVRLEDGDYIMDNYFEKVEHYSVLLAEGYQFVSRQTYLNPGVWVALDPEYSLKR